MGSNNDDMHGNINVESNSKVALNCASVVIGRVLLGLHRLNASRLLVFRLRFRGDCAGNSGAAMDVKHCSFRDTCAPCTLKIAQQPVHSTFLCLAARPAVSFVLPAARLLEGCCAVLHGGLAGTPVPVRINRFTLVVSPCVTRLFVVTPGNWDQPAGSPHGEETTGSLTIRRDRVNNYGTAV